MKPQQATIYLAGGCFWGMQAYLAGMQGVLGTQVGYANGTTSNPSYEEVCSGQTNHAETVAVTYENHDHTLRFILKWFMRAIDPTLKNQQGFDLGSQYRTGIYFVTAQQEQVAQEILRNTQKEFSKPIVTECLPLLHFFPAEDYHQEYLKKNPGGYCHISRQQINAAHAAKNV